MPLCDTAVTPFAAITEDRTNQSSYFALFDVWYMNVDGMYCQLYSILFWNLNYSIFLCNDRLLLERIDVLFWFSALRVFPVQIVSEQLVEYRDYL